jgi:UDPglucose 6-dehydrogenase
MIKKITVVGLGYVGLAQALLFNPHHDVTGYDIDEEKVRAINEGTFKSHDFDVENALLTHPLHASTDFNASVIDSDLVIIATPTHFDEHENTLDLSSLKETLEKISRMKHRPIILIKSTIYNGATSQLQAAFPHLTILFSPEFLREGSALLDNLYPSRIVIGTRLENEKERQIAEEIASIYQLAAENKPVPTLIVGTKEAEAIKLFANTYLALRVAFFNELDTYAQTKSLDSQAIINGVSLDPRIGDYYNNPSFGYGGYCLPKDTRQLKANYELIPEALISATVSANATRKTFIAKKIKEAYDNLKGNNKVIGIYRLTMKKTADNMRESSIIDIIKELKSAKLPFVIFEPLLNESTFLDYPVIKDLNTFKTMSALIVANRYFDDLDDVKEKVLTRDIKGRD